MSDDKPKCSGESYYPSMQGGRGAYLPCKKDGIHHEEGRDWCGVHAPSAVKRRKDRERARYELVMRQRERANAKASAEREVVAAAVEWRLAWVTTYLTHPAGGAYAPG